MIKKLYLVAYNLACAALWAMTLARAAACVAELGWAATGDARFYEAVKETLYVAQTMAAMEILHSLLGVVRSPVVTTVMQVFSRLLLLWGVADLVPESRASPGFVLMVLSWSTVEVPRYLFYALGQFDAVPHALKWVRYSMFIVLYPSGISGELLTAYVALPYLRERRPWSVSMPNEWNFEFDYFYFFCLALLTYIPGSPTMFGHMQKQRAKVLGGGAKRKTN